MKIMALGSCLPGPALDNQAMEKHFGVNAGWLDRMTGNKTRYYCANLLDGSTRSLCDIATEAAEEALLRASIARETLDFVLLSTATPDELMPGPVNMVLDRLGLNGIRSFQIQGGCTGAMQGLYLAQTLTAAYPQRGLVIGADTCQKFWNLHAHASHLSASELVNIAMFGDGAGAAVVSSRPEDAGVQVKHIFCRTEGLGKMPGQIARWFGATGAPLVATASGTMKPQPATDEDYKAIAQNVPVLTRQSYQELLESSGLMPGDIHYFLGPQLNRVMSDKICQALEWPEDQCIHCVQDTGNNGNALPFLQLKKLWSELQPGQRALQIAIESSKWIVSGMLLERETVA